MKKFLIVLLSVLLIAGLFVSCGDVGAKHMVKEVLGENFPKTTETSWENTSGTSICYIDIDGDNLKFETKTSPTDYVEISLKESFDDFKYVDEDNGYEVVFRVDSNKLYQIYLKIATSKLNKDLEGAYTPKF